MTSPDHLVMINLITRQLWKVGTLLLSLSLLLLDSLVVDQHISDVIKVIPWFCIAQTFLRITWAHFCVSSQSPPRQFSILRVISESMTTFHGSLWGNKPGNPRFFFKNSLINNIFEEEKKFDSRTWFFWKNTGSSVLDVFWPRRGLKANHSLILRRSRSLAVTHSLPSPSDGLHSRSCSWRHDALVLSAPIATVRKSAIFPPPDNQIKNGLSEAVLLMWIKKALLSR